MIIVMDKDISQEEVQTVKDRLGELDLDSHVITGKHKLVLGVIGENKQEAISALEALPYVEKILQVSKPYKLVSREAQEEDTEIKIPLPSGSSTITIGGGSFSLMAGPCAIENRNNIHDVAKAVKQAGGQILRGGAFKPRTSPYSFQGLGEEGLKYLQEAGQEQDLVTITEAMDSREVALVSEYADMIQIGARNMQNFQLLKEVGASKRPVMLKRGMSAKLEEWLMAAEYIISHGNQNVMLCERGIRSFDTATRNTLDLASVSLAKQFTHLPIIVDPSHGTGNWKLVPQMSLAALAAGADGVMVEVHPTPETAFSDGSQSLTYANLNKLTTKLKGLCPHFDKDYLTQKSGNQDMRSIGF